MLAGYLHPGYAESLAASGTPFKLPKCGGWILERQIPGFPYQDAMGCYPLFACQDWSQLHADLENVNNELVSLSLVTDPFGEYEPAYLRRCFKDVVKPFKEHFIVDLHCPVETFISGHHRRYAQKALKDVYLERCQNPSRFVKDWIALYETLVERHNIKGVPAFSEEAFVRQFQVPGIVCFRAVHNETTIGMILWYVSGDVGYYHLGAYSALGYQLRASFALFWNAIEYFSTRLRWLNLGAGAGIDNSGMDGLSRFKRGWSTETRMAFFCGRIFDNERYMEIVNTKRTFNTNYFPAYRNGEFT